MAQRPDATNTVIRTIKTMGPDGQMRTVVKTEETTMMSGKRTVVTTTTGDDGDKLAVDDGLPWHSLSLGSQPTESVRSASPRSMRTFGDSTLYGDDWSSITSRRSDPTVIRDAQRVQQYSPGATRNSGSNTAPPTTAASPARSPISKKLEQSSGQLTKADLATFRSKALKMHNEYRARHGAVPLVLDDQLNAYAQEWAEHLAASALFKHRPRDDRKCGENLFYGSNSRGIKPEEAIDSWYAEYNNYDFNRPGFASNTGHFTQLVWKDSRRLGLGVAVPQANVVYVVGNYDPPGNIVGAENFRRNVADKN